MPADTDLHGADLKGEELSAIIREIQERVRARFPKGDAANLGVPLPDLLPVLHARDAAEGKVAAIGSVNPRAPGILNSLIQWSKQQIARGLGWFVRDQVEFNRSVLGCIQALLTALNESNQALVAMSSRIETVREDAAEMKDIRAHWLRWREEWERKLFTNEVQYLRSVADLQAGFQHRTVMMESNFRDTVKHQHADFVATVDRSMKSVQDGMWTDLERIRIEYERLIHTELRMIRQRALIAVPPAVPSAGTAPPAAGPAPMPFDYARFADRFRGSEEYVRANQEPYIPYFTGRQRVLDIGCGRGEFLGMMQDNHVQALGIDLDAESVAICRSKGLTAENADLFTYLAGLPDAALDGIFSSQVVEHLPPERLPEMVRLAAAKLQRGGVIAIETPNPECLAIFATHFYLDPTHTRPVPPALLVFYLEEFGFGRIEVKRLAPAVNSLPSLGSLPEGFREAFFGGLDYAIIAEKL